jgi:ABC-type glycerol-3-phosphate transport system substrate-binding protein
VRIALVLTVSVLALAACGETRQVEREPGLSTRASSSGTGESAPKALIFRRADGSEIEMGKPLVWCGPWNDEIPDQTIQVAVIGDVQRTKRP